MVLQQNKKAAQIEEDSDLVILSPSAAATEKATPTEPSNIIAYCNYACVLRGDTTMDATRFIRAPLGRSKREVIRILSHEDLFHELIDVETQRIAVSVPQQINYGGSTGLKLEWAEIGNNIDVGAFLGVTFMQVVLKESPEIKARRALEERLWTRDRHRRAVIVDFLALFGEVSAIMAAVLAVVIYAAWLARLMK